MACTLIKIFPRPLPLDLNVLDSERAGWMHDSGPYVLNKAPKQKVSNVA